jgi:hypothetical protein
LGQVLSMVERTKDEVSAGVTELAKKVERAHLGVAVVVELEDAEAGVFGATLAGSGTKRPG